LLNLNNTVAAVRLTATAVIPAKVMYVLTSARLLTLLT
jgi:hypothetical protein